MIKAIIFDLGGVLDKGKPEEHWAELCRSLNLDIKRFQEVRSKYTPLARIGKLSTKEFIAHIAKDLDLKSTILYSAWLRTKRENMQIDPNIKRLFQHLKKEGYVIGTVSNVIGLHHQIRLENKAYDHLDFEIISFKEGIDKPHPQIYQLALEKLKLQPQEIVFIDDSKRNCETASQLGMKTILFKDNTQLILELKQLGVKI